MLQVSETVFDTINHEYDKTEQKRAKQKKAKFGTDEKDSDCILHGYIKKLVNCLASAEWSKYSFSLCRVVPSSPPGKPDTPNCIPTG